MRRMVKEQLLKFDGTPLFPERLAYTVPYKLSDAEARLYKAGHRLRARGVQPRRGARERQARRHRRLRADHPPAPARLVARGDLPVAAPPPRAAGEAAARAGAAAARRRRSRRSLPRLAVARRRRPRRSRRCARQRGRGGRGGDRRSGHGGAHDRRAEGRDRHAAAARSARARRASQRHRTRKWRELASLLGEIFTPRRSRRVAEPIVYDAVRSEASPRRARSSSSSPSTATR